MGTTRTWFGGIGQFNNPRDWSPRGVPQSGDLAVISSGTVRVANGSLLDVPIHLGSTDPATAPVLIARNEDFGRIMVGSNPPPPEELGSPKEFADMVVGGVVTIHSLEVAAPLTSSGSSSPGDLEITLKNNGTLDLDKTGGWDQQPNGTLNISGGHRSAFENDGTVTSIGGSMDVDTRVLGTGTFNVEFGRSAAGSLTFEKSVGAGETVNLIGGTAELILKEPMKFLGQINEGPGAFVELPGQTATSSSYQSDTGILSIFNDDTLIAALRINPVNGTDFNVSLGGPDVLITVAPPTTAAATSDPSVAPIMVPSMG